MKLRFETPSDGWMAIQLNDREMAVSDIPCDSLMMLTSALAGILSGSPSEIIEWSLEPEYAAWIFSRSGPNLTFSLREDSGSEAIVIERNEPTVIVDQILAALSDLSECDFWVKDAEDLHIWSWPFPANELNRLKSKRE
ncbi:MAG: hypothetical protein V4689_16100 [Verrucomicrobiota bacterium]